MKKLMVLAVLFTSVVAFGQKTPTTENSCNLQSCRSFHELLNNKDADMLEKISSDNNAFVCFRSSEDVFFIAEYSKVTSFHWIPDMSNWQKDSTSGPYYAYGSASVTTYKSGQEDAWYGANGKWKAYGHLAAYTPKNGSPLVSEGIPPIFGEKCAQTEGEECSFFIDNAAFKLFRNFDNKNGGKTDYKLEVRLSTGRYSETFSWNKSKDLDAGEDTDTGRCELYNNGKRSR